MFTSTAALLAGATEAAVVLGAVAEVGMAVSVVGAVTGEEDLVKAGSIMGLVGGVGSMAMGAASGGSGVAMSAADEAVASGGGFMGEAAASAGYGIGSGAADLAGAALNSAGQWVSGESLTDAGSMFDWGTAAQEMASAEPINWAGSASAISDEAVASGGGFQIAQQGMEQGAISDAMRAGESVAKQQSSGIVQQAMPTKQDMMQQAQRAVSNQPTQSASSTLSQKATGGEMTTAAQAVEGRTSTNDFFGGLKKVGEWAEKNKTMAGLLMNVGGNMVLGAMKNDAESEALALKRREIELAERKFANAQQAPAAGVAARSPMQNPIINGVRK